MLLSKINSKGDFFVKKRGILLSGIILFTVVHVFGVVNIESQRSLDLVEGFAGKVSLNTNAKGGNTEKENLGLGSRLDWKSLKSHQFWILNYEYGESSKMKDTNKFFSHLRTMHQWDELKSIEFFAQISSNEFTRLVYKGLLGGGIRWMLGGGNDEIEINLGTGAFFAHEKLDDQLSQDENKEEKIVRANIYLNLIWPINERSKVVNTLYYQPYFYEMEDYYLLDQMTFVFKVSDRFSLKWSFDVSKDNRPPEGVKSTDWAYQTGIDYEF